MGTRALIKFYKEEKGGQAFCCIYRQFDGYPEGLGQELVEILAARRRTNGFGQGDTGKNAANGIQCLAAQIVCLLKQGNGDNPGIGNVYLYPPDSKGVGEEYVYEVRPADAGWHLTIWNAHWDKGPTSILAEGVPSDALIEAANKAVDQD